MLRKTTGFVLSKDHSDYEDDDKSLKSTDSNSTFQYFGLDSVPSQMKSSSSSISSSDKKTRNQSKKRQYRNVSQKNESNEFYPNDLSSRNKKDGSLLPRNNSSSEEEPNGMTSSWFQTFSNYSNQKLLFLFIVSIAMINMLSTIVSLMLKYDPNHDEYMDMITPIQNIRDDDFYKKSKMDMIEQRNNKLGIKADIQRDQMNPLNQENQQRQPQTRKKKNQVPQMEFSPAFQSNKGTIVDLDPNDKEIFISKRDGTQQRIWPGQEKKEGEDNNAEDTKETVTDSTLSPDASGKNHTRDGVQSIIQNTANSRTNNEIIASPYKIAYVLPVFECYKYKARDHTALEEDEVHEQIQDSSFLDAAAVLKYSIHRNSIHNPQLKPRSRYSYQMVALVHPDVQECYDSDGFSRVDALRLLGYDVRIMDVPVPLEDIKGDFLRKSIQQNPSSNGGRDLIRLHAFQFIEFDVVVLLDLRTLMLRPLDTLIDLLVACTDKNAIQNYQIMGRVQFADTTILPTSATVLDVSALYSRDYSSVSPGKYQVGIYPGLFLLKPSRDTFEELVSILQEGDFRRESGWGGSGIGDFWGDTTTRGILSYYYDVLHPRAGLEIHRCKYNNMGTTPFIRDNGDTICRNPRENPPNCLDCRSFPMGDILVSNLSACRDPWSCYVHNNHENLQLCREMHKFWFRLRRELEGAWTQYGGGGEFGYTSATLVQPGKGLDAESYLGYCKFAGREGYIPIVPPGNQAKPNGPALDPNAVMNQYSANLDTNGIRKPKKHFDPEKIMFQFQEGHPKQDQIG